MPSRAEGSVSLQVSNTTAVFMSVVAAAVSLSIKPTAEAHTQAPSGAETTHILPGPKTIKTIGETATQSNYYERYDYKPIPKEPPITDANSVDTPDWTCIVNDESHGDYEQTSGAFGDETSTWRALAGMGFVLAANYPTPGSAPPEIQNEANLFLYARNHYKFKGTWNDSCTEEGIVS